MATLFVGDICDYTVPVRRVPSAVLPQSVNRVFERLSRVVGELGGTVKEYQSDAAGRDVCAKLHIEQYRFGIKSRL